MSTVLYMVIPCYNEEKVPPITAKLFLEELQILIRKGKICNESRILFVDDGSKDSTWKIICGLACENEHFLVIRQSQTEVIKMQCLQA